MDISQPKENLFKVIFLKITISKSSGRIKRTLVEGMEKLSLEDERSIRDRGEEEKSKTVVRWGISRWRRYIGILEEEARKKKNICSRLRLRSRWERGEDWNSYVYEGWKKTLVEKIKVKNYIMLVESYYLQKSDVLLKKIMAASLADVVKMWRWITDSELLIY